MPSSEPCGGSHSHLVSFFIYTIPVYLIFKHYLLLIFVCYMCMPEKLNVNFCILTVLIRAIYSTLLSRVKSNNFLLKKKFNRTDLQLHTYIRIRLVMLYLSDH